MKILTLLSHVGEFVSIRVKIMGGGGKEFNNICRRLKHLSIFYEDTSALRHVK